MRNGRWKTITAAPIGVAERISYQTALSTAEPYDVDCG